MDRESATQDVSTKARDRRRQGGPSGGGSPQGMVIDQAEAAPELAEPARYDNRGLLRPAERVAARRDSLRRRALAAADLCALTGAFLVVLVVAPGGEAIDLWLLAPALPGWLLLHKILGLYDRDRHLVHKSTLNELPKIVQSITLGTALLFMFGPLVPGAELPRGEAVGFLAAALVTVPLLRGGTRAAIGRLVAPERCLILGSGHVAALVARKIQAHPEYGARLVGYVDTDGGGPRRDSAPGLPLLGDIDDFEAVCRSHEVQRVIIAFSSLSHERILDLVRAAKREHVDITIVPRLFEVIGSRVEIDQIEGMTLLGLRGTQRTRSTLALKRGLDLVGASAGLLLLAPLLVSIAVAVKSTSRGPVLFGQRRVGRANRQFCMWKFRTMVHGADAMKDSLAHLNDLAEGPMFKILDDPRVTPVGRLLRRTSLDELPQLWNVLRGEMSLVGPRPLVPFEDDHVLGWHRSRLELTPGLTGPWQVQGRTAIPFDEMVKLDYLYVAEWSLWNDAKLLVQTLPVVFGRRGA